LPLPSSLFPVPFFALALFSQCLLSYLHKSNV
jgi:hypothetical protein